MAKRQVFLRADLECKVLLMHAYGISYDGICRELHQFYGIEASPAFISELTDKVVPVMEAWGRRALDEVYCFVFFDAMHSRVQAGNGTVESQMLYLAYGIRNTRHKEVQDLETRFKEEDDPFRLVIVCAMWITGFDVPTLSTMYLDKPLKSHMLMQAIARANRIREGKNNGLIVDYIETYTALLDPLAIYGTGGLKAVVKNPNHL